MTDSAVQVARTGFSSREFRSALGAFATGVTVITSAGDEPYGMTANAFSSLSLDPPLVLVCVVNGTRGCDAIEGNGIFAVNILSEDQEAIARYFASRDRPRGPGAFADIAHRAGVTGAPIIDEAAAYLDCRLTQQHVAGDHTIFVGEVRDLEFDPDARPLLFHAGRFARLGDD